MARVQCLRSKVGFTFSYLLQTPSVAAVCLQTSMSAGLKMRALSCLLSRKNICQKFVKEKIIGYKICSGVFISLENASGWFELVRKNVQSPHYSIDIYLKWMTEVLQMFPTSFFFYSSDNVKSNDISCLTNTSWGKQFFIQYS